jgi:hypothetical protein
VATLTDNYEHLSWVKGLIDYLSDPDMSEDEKKTQLTRAADYFTNQTSPEKRDIFLYILGALVLSVKMDRLAYQAAENEEDDVE